MALSSALWPAFHVLEVSVRNTLYSVGENQTAGRILTFGLVPCWLDAGILEKTEQDDVQKAVQRLGMGRQTAGHLVGELSFGFWTRLCNRPYEHGRKGGPALWPEAAKRFYRCPRPKRNRDEIGKTLDHLAYFRNRLAHHHPIWDRRPDKRLAEIVETIGWLSPGLGEAVSQTSNVRALFDGGHLPFRDLASAVSCVFV